ncbi:MAG: hypothetical protein M3Y34_09175 [Actinomycetota bacterium]|nr:hypothetical protein [Actinomycetota bacterium]
MPATNPSHEPPAERILAIVDWNLDPGAVVEELGRRAGVRRTVFGLLVPARLALLDWIGDPKASCPCAARQLEELAKRGADTGLAVAAAATGDPERVSAARNVLAGWQADRVVLFERARRKPLKRASVESRLRRSTRLPIEVVNSPLRISPESGGRFQAPARCRAELG